MLARIFQSARPYTRWWWFSGPIDAAAIRYQLDWLAANGFGGVEIAWMYPLDNSPCHLRQPQQNKPRLNQLNLPKR